MRYYQGFRMRFSADNFTTDWQRLEVGIAAGCTISVVLFVLVMEMLLKAANTSITLMKPNLKAFMDDITVLAKDITVAEQTLEKIDRLITWSRMKFKAKKSRSCTLIKGKAKEFHFNIAGERIPTVKEQPVKSLGRWYGSDLSDRHKGIEIFKQAEDRLKAIDKTKLSGRFKTWFISTPSMAIDDVRSRVFKGGKN